MLLFLTYASSCGWLVALSLSRDKKTPPERTKTPISTASIRAQVCATREKHRQPRADTPRDAGSWLSRAAFRRGLLWTVMQSQRALNEDEDGGDDDGGCDGDCDRGGEDDDDR